MKVHHDEKADAVCFRFDESRIIELEEVQPWITLDFAARDQVSGIEVLRVKRRVSEASLKQPTFEMA